MWKKAIFRVTLIGFIALGGLLVFAASHAARKIRSAASEQTTCNDGEQNSRGEFIIFETLSRNILSTVNN